MCTLSIVFDAGGGYRLMHNRDEQRGRAPGLPPSWRTLPGGAAVLCPLDPVGGGTWIAVRRDGVSAGMLNLNLEPPPVVSGAALRSRGTVPLDLLGRLAEGVGASGLWREAARAAAGLELDRLAPFRVVVVAPGTGGPGACAVVRWDRITLAVTRPPGGQAACSVSSGLGDSRVMCRVPLFDEMVGREPTAGAQEAFHRHRWPERPEVSVLMERADARTVSISTLEVDGGGVRLGVEAVAE
jgi:hypothetical protein